MNIKIFLYVWTILVFVIGILFGYFLNKHKEPKKVRDEHKVMNNDNDFDINYYIQLKPYRDLLRKHNNH